MKKERQKLEPQSELEPWHKAGIFWPREWAKQRHTETGAETATESTEEEVANGFLSFSRSRFTAITRTVWLVKGRECWPQQTIWQLPELANWGELKGHVNYLMSRARRLQLWLCAELQVTKICFCLSLTFLSLFTLFVVLLFVATNLLFAY